MSDSDFYKDIWKKHCVSKYKDTFTNIKNIICIGDIHGDFELLIASLKLANVIDDDLKWKAKNTYVVQLGDQIDSYRPSQNMDKKIRTNEPKELKILLYMTYLNINAQKYNSAVISLIGNHELMNIYNDFSYVEKEGFKEFETFFTHEYGKTGRLIRENVFKPGNILSTLIGCTRQVIVKINDILFVHGGILTEVAEKFSITDINQIMAIYLFNELKEIDKKIFDELFNSSISPLHTREYHTKNYCNCIDMVLIKYKAKCIVVGHTPILKKNNVLKCNKKIIFTDYAGSFAFDSFFPSKRKIRVIYIKYNNDYTDYDINILTK